MSAYVFDPPPVVTLPILGEDAVFPVRRILCVGRNYQAHRAEMGDTSRDPPFFFSKPADALVPAGRDPAYPPMTQNLHHEVELVVALSGGGADVAAEDALGLVFGYAVGVDLTRRDLQNAAKDKGHPWESGKAFDDSAPISAIRRWDAATPSPTGAISIEVNGEVKQSSTVDNMIWTTAEVIAEASKLWTLAPGDLIFTGTPEGVGKLVAGDKVTCEVAEVGTLHFTVG